MKKVIEIKERLPLLINKTLKTLYHFKNQLFILICCILIANFFKGFLGYGLEFDKIFRTNNIIPLLNPDAYQYNQAIFSLSLFGNEIPLMYKAYVSPIFLILYLPLYLFDDYYFGLKILDFIYFILSVLLSYKIVQKYTNYAYVFASLLIVSPILYPEILFGFVSNFHVLLYLYSGHLLYQYYKNDQSNRWLLFGGTFLLFFSSNLTFYNTWILVSILIIILLFFRRQLIRTLLRPKDLLIVSVAFFIGLFNYIIYNIVNGFPSVTPLLLKIFFPEKYNENPIDFKETRPIIEDINYKLNDVIPNFFDGYFNFVIIGLIFFLFAYVFILVIILRRKRGKEFKYYFIPIIGLILVFILILVSPNTTRPEHYVRTSPFLELSIISIVLLYTKVFSGIYIKRLSIILLLVYIGFNIFISHTIIKKAYVNKGTGLFTPAIFDLNNYLNANCIDYNNIIHTEWGFYSQLYFLNNGEVKTNSMVFQLFNKKEPELSQVLQNNIIEILQKRPINSDLFFPIWSGRFLYISDAFLKVVNKMGGTVIKQKVFYEKTGQEVIYLYKVTGIDSIYRKKKTGRIDLVNSSEIISFINYTESDYSLTEGVYSLEKGFCWYSQNAKILLNSINKTEFVISFHIPDINKYSMPPYLSIYFNNSMVYKEQITSSGSFVKKIVISEEFNLDQIIVNLIISKPLNAKGDSRNLGIAVKQIGFK